MQWVDAMQPPQAVGERNDNDEREQIDSTGRNASPRQNNNVASARQQSETRRFWIQMVATIVAPIILWVIPSPYSDEFPRIFSDWKTPVQQEEHIKKSCPVLEEQYVPRKRRKDNFSPQHESNAPRNPSYYLG